MSNPLSIPCPRCRVPAGKPCRSITGASVNVCKSRLMSCRTNPDEDCDCGEEASCDACQSCENCCQCEVVCECGESVDCQCGCCIECCECDDLMPSDYFRNPSYLPNPWSSKEDVRRHNKKAASSAKAMKLWLKVANETLERTGDDRMAIIAANIAVKNHFKKHGF